MADGVEPLEPGLPTGADGDELLAGISDRGMNQAGRDAPSSALWLVSRSVRVTLTEPPEPPSVATHRSMLSPLTCRNAIWSPAGDQTGA